MTNDPDVTVVVVPRELSSKLQISLESIYAKHLRRAFTLLLRGRSDLCINLDYRDLSLNRPPVAARIAAIS